jgi:DNA-binding transcriptional LysR family regulator
MKPLEIDTVQIFALIADLQSFTRAAQAAGTTQSAVSTKLKHLEQRLGCRLVERTPRLVRLTPDGAAFLARARDLLAAHQRALAPQTPAPHRLVIGVSDHAAGPEFPAMLARVNAYDPTLALELRIGFSRALLDSYDRGKLDAVIVRREASRRGGEKLASDQFGWFALPQFRCSGDEPLKVALLAPPCGVRAAAIRALDKS